MKMTATLLLCVAAVTSAVPMAIAQPVPAAEPPPGIPVYKCPRELCEIKVDVDACKTGGARVDRPLVAAHDTVLLRWSITTPGPVFEDPGIRIVAPDGEFEARPSTAPNEARLFGRNSIMGEFTYGYTLHVQGCPPLQAWIRNVAL